MTKPAYEHTKMGRTYEALREWWESGHIRGEWNSVGAAWESHPDWATPSDRQHWHKNWGELLNYHTTAHIRTVAGANRLTVRVTHPDAARLELVRSVAGGTIEAASGPRTVFRLQIERVAAFQALKCGRLYVDPANEGLFEVLDAAMGFYQHVPRPGEAASDSQVAGQEARKEQLERLIGQYSTSRRGLHDCQEGITRAGSPDWSADLASKPDFGPFTG